MKTANAPIIIKRKKVIQGGGHHGGAWKVAIYNCLFEVAAHFAPKISGYVTEGRRVKSHSDLPQSNCLVGFHFGYILKCIGGPKHRLNAAQRDCENLI